MGKFDTYVNYILNSEEVIIKKFPKVAEGLPRGIPLCGGGWDYVTVPLIQAVMKVFTAEEIKQKMCPATVFGKSARISDMDNIIKKQRRIIAGELGDFAANELVRDIAAAVANANQAEKGGGRH